MMKEPADRADLSPVRQAYRYAVAYQRRLQDALLAVDQHLTQARFTLVRWKPIYFSRTPSGRSTSPFNRWAWDYFSMYGARFFWALDGQIANESGTRVIWLDHIVDSAFESREGKGEPDPLSLAPAESSQTLLRVRWVSVEQGMQPQLFNQSWTRICQTVFEMDIERIWAMQPGDERTKRANQVLQTGSWVVDVETMDSREVLYDTLIDPLRKLAEELVSHEV